MRITYISILIDVRSEILFRPFNQSQHFFFLDFIFLKYLRTPAAWATIQSIQLLFFAFHRHSWLWFSFSCFSIFFFVKLIFLTDKSNKTGKKMCKSNYAHSIFIGCYSVYFFQNVLVIIWTEFLFSNAWMMNCVMHNLRARCFLNGSVVQ